MTGMFPDYFWLMIFKLIVIVSFTVAIVFAFLETTRIRYADEFFRPLAAILLVPLSLFLALYSVRIFGLYVELFLLSLSILTILFFIRKRFKK